MQAPREARLAALAATATRQYGVVSILQLYELGFTKPAIGRMVAAGRLHAVYRGVYAVGHRSLSLHGRVMAAVLAAGPGAVASHSTAAWLHEIRRGHRGWIHVTVEGEGRRRREGFRLHLTRDLHDEDVTEVDRIPCTSLARTLLDEADLLTQQQLEKRIEEAERRGLFDGRAVDQACGRANGRRGVTRWREVLPEVKTRSDLERDFRAFCRRHGIPEPGFNLWVEGQEVDAAWLDEKVVVELDSYEYHAHRAAFERDRERSTALAAAKWRPMRVTGRRMKRDAERLAGELKQALAG
ncbi:MAG: hypothetical protein M3340_11425 [Actinomycetota bacterium]|nr:hypothetical protein [Actinomycetota bacterium]